MNDTMLHRSGHTSASGKCTQRLDVPVSDRLNDAIIAMATLAGLPKAEYARRLLEQAMFGQLDMVRSVSGLAPTGQWDESRTEARP